MTVSAVRLLLPATGLLVAALLWAAGTAALTGVTPVAASFSPQATLPALWQLLGDPWFWKHIVLSLQRVGVGLGFALLIGVPLGLLVGTWDRLRARHFAAVSIPAHDLAAVVDAACSHDAGGRQCTGVLPARLRRSLAHSAEHGSRRSRPRPELADAGAQSVGNKNRNRF